MACSIPIDDLPREHRAGEKPTVRKNLTVASPLAIPSNLLPHHDRLV